MKLTDHDVKKIAHLARLHLEDDEITQYRQELDNILVLVEQLQAIDVSGIEPMAHPLNVPQRLRTDSVTEHNCRERMLALAPQTEAGLYLVPKVIDTPQ